MSYTQHTAIATCTIANVLDTNDLISNVYDYLTNHEDEGPTSLLDCETFEEFADQLEPYVQLEDNTLTITLDTDESNNDSEVFDFMVEHYTHLMTSKFIKVVGLLTIVAQVYLAMPITTTQRVKSTSQTS